MKMQRHSELRRDNKVHYKIEITKNRPNFMEKLFIIIKLFYKEKLLNSIAVYNLKKLKPKICCHPWILFSFL